MRAMRAVGESRCHEQKHAGAFGANLSIEIDLRMAPSTHKCTVLARVGFC